MSVTVRIPTQLRTLTGGAARSSSTASTVGDVLKALDAAHPGFAGRLFDDAGGLRRFVNVFLADEDVRFLEGLATAGERRADPLDRARPSPEAEWPYNPSSLVRAVAVASSRGAWFAVSTRQHRVLMT